MQVRSKKQIITTAVLALTSVIVVVLVSIYGIKTGFIHIIKPIKKVAHHLPLKPIEQFIKIENSVVRGDTIIALLTREGVARQSAFQLFSDIKTVYDLRQICAGKRYTLYFSQDKKEMERFHYQIDPARSLDVYRDAQTNSYKANIASVPYKVKVEFVEGVIDDSLFGSILAKGEKPELADMMASLYEYDIDFNRDIRKQDSYSLLVEKMYLNGNFIRYGNILTAEFTNRGKTVQVVRYTDPTGNTAFYHPDGRSVRKMFLRCPLPFMHVTSSYGNRTHPLLGYSAKHNGVDLGAPIGTPIKSTASGVVRAMAYDGAKGKFISISHTNHYVSHYYHMSRYSTSIKPGSRVEQGQVIGYVGSTGWSTGPHLHYGLQRNGLFLNPLKLESPTTDPVSPKFMENFKAYSLRLALLSETSRFAPIPVSISARILGTPVH